MKLNLKSISLIALVLLVFSCGSDDDSTPTPVNTDVFFKYTLNGGTEKEVVFYEYSAYFGDATGQATDNFEFNIQGSSNFVENITGAFRFSDGTFSSFVSNPTTTTYLWGYPGTAPNPVNSTALFFFDTISPNVFYPTLDSAITTTITEYPTNVGSYIAFNFTGTYTDANDASNTGTISGSARLKRGDDRLIN
jgi:hypothetical protein